MNGLLLFSLLQLLFNGYVQALDSVELGNSTSSSTGRSSLLSSGTLSSAVSSLAFSSHSRSIDYVTASSSFDIFSSIQSPLYSSVRSKQPISTNRESSSTVSSTEITSSSSQSSLEEHFSSSEFTSSTEYSESSSSSEEILPITSDSSLSTGDQTTFTSLTLVTSIISGHIVVSDVYATVTQSISTSTDLYPGLKHSNSHKSLSKHDRDIIIGCCIGLGIPFLILCFLLFYFLYYKRTKKVDYINSEGQIVTAYDKNIFFKKWNTLIGKEDRVEPIFENNDITLQDPNVSSNIFDENNVLQDGNNNDYQEFILRNSRNNANKFKTNNSFNRHRKNKSTQLNTHDFLQEEDRYYHDNDMTNPIFENNISDSPAYTSHNGTNVQTSSSSNDENSSSSNDSDHSEKPMEY